jgi:hypothetical protein
MTLARRLLMAGSGAGGAGNAGNLMPGYIRITKV